MGERGVVCGKKAERYEEKWCRGAITLSHVAACSPLVFLLQGLMDKQPPPVCLSAGR